MLISVETVLSRIPAERLCRALAVQPETLARFRRGEYEQPEIVAEIERRLCRAGLLPQSRHDS